MKFWDIPLVGKFFKDNSGAVTVDWVVLTAAIVGLGMVVIIPIADGTDSMSAKTASYIDDVPVGFMDD
jgi:hypothetical protein